MAVHMHQKVFGCQFYLLSYISIPFFVAYTGHITKVFLLLNGSYDVFLKPLLAFWGLNDKTLHLQVKTLWIGIFKPKWTM